MPEDQQIPSDVGPGPLVDVAQALSDVARSLEAEPDLTRFPAPSRPGCRSAKAISCGPSPRPMFW